MLPYKDISIWTTKPQKCVKTSRVGQFLKGWSCDIYLNFAKPSEMHFPVFIIFSPFALRKKIRPKQDLTNPYIKSIHDILICVTGIICSTSFKGLH